jgi:hypothetical protein
MAEKDKKTDDIEIPKEVLPEIPKITRNKLNNDQSLYEDRPKQIDKINFNKLSWGTLRKFQYYTKLGTDLKDNGKSINRKDLLDRIEKHFNEDLKIDSGKIIINFLKTKKDDNGNYFLRKTRGAGGASAPSRGGAVEG